MTRGPEDDGPDGDEQQPEGAPRLFVRRIDGVAAREPEPHRSYVDLTTATTRDGELAADLSHLTLQGLAERALSGGDGGADDGDGGTESRATAVRPAAVSDVLGADPSTGDGPSPTAGRRSPETAPSASADRPARDSGATGRPADGRGPPRRRPRRGDHTGDPGGTTGDPGGNTGDPGEDQPGADGSLPGHAVGDPPGETGGPDAGASRPGDAGPARRDAGEAGRSRSPADERGPAVDARDRQPTSPSSVAERAGSDERSVDDLYRELRRRERIERERRGLDERE